MEKPFKCTECDLRFTTNAARNIHSKTHKPKEILSCTLCNYHTQCHGKMRKHRLREHCSNITKIRVEKVSATKPRLYKCNHCSKTFSIEHKFKKHLREHCGNNKAFHCSKGDKALSQKNDVDSHIRIRVLSGDKPFQCSKCDKDSYQMDSLLSHARLCQYKPFRCIKCYKAFPSKESLDSHTRIHLGVKPFKCIKCGKAYSSKSSLTNHIKHHIGYESPQDTKISSGIIYSCYICSVNFTDINECKRHIQSHTRKENISNVQSDVNTTSTFRNCSQNALVEEKVADEDSRIDIKDEVKDEPIENSDANYDSNLWKANISNDGSGINAKIIGRNFLQKALEEIKVEDMEFMIKEEVTDEPTGSLEAQNESHLLKLEI